MSYRATKSEWDSDVFNIPIGNLDLHGHVPRLERIKADNKQFDVVFCKAEGWVDVPGADLEDQRYDMELLETGAQVKRGRVAPVNCVSTAHLAIANEAFTESRFNRDSRLRPRAYELYAKWLATAPTVYALMGQHQDTSFCAIRDTKDGKRIDLLAVAASCRGAGLGQALCRAMFGALPLRPWRVRVSARNYRALRFYESLGFKVRDVSTVFHVWTHGDRI